MRVCPNARLSANEIMAGWARVVAASACDSSGRIVARWQQVHVVVAASRGSNARIWWQRFLVMAAVSCGGNGGREADSSWGASTKRLQRVRVGKGCGC
jgi:predicted Zn-dependent protease